MTTWSDAPPRSSPGFSMVELLMVLAIVGVLATAAVPSFVDYVRRGRIVEAVTRLSDHRVRMEQFFLDNRRYDDGAGGCGYAAPPIGAADAFAVECVAGASAYTITVRGLASKSMADFAYALDQANAQKTVSLPNGWTGSDWCWVVRRDGSCV